MTAVAAVVIGGIIGPLLLVAVAIVVPASYASVLGRLLRTTLLLSLPIAISALLINLFFFPGGETVLLRLGPLTTTLEGLLLGIAILVRIIAISGAITLFYLTTDPRALTLDLERRGVSPRIAFVANASIQTVPAMLERANAITAAQRARGLDTEGSFLRRVRGIVPIVGPTILGSIGEVEERTMALEARAFGRPGQRSLLWAPPDTRAQQLVRWGLVLVLPALIGSRILGLLG